jgi:hypothetical protein
LQVPYELRLPTRFRQAGWKVKIREKETREPPHVTILRQTRAWRINLRTGEFMDAEPSPADVPKELVAYIKRPAIWQRLCEEWDRKYPTNPVVGAEGGRDEEG